MKPTDDTSPSSNVTPFPAKSSPSQSVTKTAEKLDVVVDVETGRGCAVARSHEGEGKRSNGGGGDSAGDVGTGSQLVVGAREDVGDIIERRGMRTKALDQLDQMLDAVTYLWDARAQTYNERIDYITRMKAITEILNRTDGLPKRYMEVLQAIAHSNTKGNAPTDAELTPAAAESLRRMLAEFDGKRGGGARSEKRAQITPGKKG